MNRRAISPGTRLPSLGGRTGLWALAAGMAATAGVVALSIRTLPPADDAFQVSWLLIAGLFAGTESFVVRTPRQRRTHVYSMSELPFVLGLFLLSPAELVVAIVVGSAAALILVHRSPPLRLAYNLAQYALGAALAGLAFHAIAGQPPDPGSPRGVLAALAAVALTTVVSELAIQWAVARAEQRSLDAAQRATSLLHSLLTTTVTAALAIVAVRSLMRDPFSLLLLLAPATMLLLAYRAISRAEERHTALTFLYDATRMLHGERAFDEALEELLRRAASALGTDCAELVLFPSEDGEPPLVTRVERSATTMLMQAVDRDARSTALVELLGRGSVLGGTAHGSDRELAGYLVRRGWTSALLAPLQGERRIVGALMVADLPGAASRFEEKDFELFATLADQIAVALENGRLERSLSSLRELQDRLRHQALHDPLTGLGNRTLLIERIEHALARSTREDERPAVLFIDLDEFKQVNNRFGHEAGDELLRAIAARLANCVRPSDTAARLGGDEFAVVVEGHPDVAVVEALAQRICDALRAAVELSGQRIEVCASVGVAFAPEHERDYGVLLRHADAAMYEAKRHPERGYALYGRDVVLDAQAPPVADARRSA